VSRGQRNESPRPYSRQIYWQVSLKRPFTWRFLKILSKFVGVRAVLGTLAADIFFKRSDLEVLPD
jgi:hypothetical protein